MWLKVETRDLGVVFPESAALGVLGFQGGGGRGAPFSCIFSRSNSLT